MKDKKIMFYVTNVFTVIGVVQDKRDRVYEKDDINLDI